MRTSCVLVAAGLLGALLTTCPATLAQTASPPSPPGPPPRDQIASYVSEASHRFGIPEAWITAVMHVESGGDASATSPAGAIGLMQVMPDTYANLRTRLGLGANAYDPHDNIMAGAAYLRELHDRYGAVGFLAAYNAGPGRWEDHLAGVRPLPPETIRYLARLAPMLAGNGAGTLARAVSLAATTPETAPIFVALSTRPLAAPQRPAGSVAVQLAAVPASADEQTGALFTARQPAADSHSNGVDKGGSSISVPFRPGAPSSETAPLDASPNPLFVRQLSAQGQPR